MLDGQEITQFTYFQQVGGIDLDLVPAEITYGLERLTQYLQGVDSVYDIEWTPGVKYRDVRYTDELQYSVYNFEVADVPTLWKLFDIHEGEAKRLLDLYRESKADNRFPLLATYDHVLKCSNLFNTLDARGAISVTERVAVIGRIRKLAVQVAESWQDQQAASQVGQGFGPAAGLPPGADLPMLDTLPTRETLPTRDTLPSRDPASPLGVP